MVAVVVAAGCELAPAADDAGINFGYAVDHFDLAEDPRYVEVVDADSNMVTLENAMKWDFIHPGIDTYDFGPADAIVAHAAANGQTVRGHPLIWHTQVPDWLDAGLHDDTNGIGFDDGTWAAMWTREELIDVMRDHIETVVGHYRDNFPGVVTQYDVVNEPFWPDGTLRPNIWQQIIGDEYIELALEFAHAADPTAELYINDFLNETLIILENTVHRAPQGIGANSQRTTCDEVPKCILMRTWATDLVSRGVPLDGIGMEGHQFAFLADGPPDYDVLLDWTVGLGLRWAITEMDVVLAASAGDDPAWLEDQAEWYGSMVEDCVAAPNCDTVVVWGASDAHSWFAESLFGHAGLREEDYALKPAWWEVLRVLAVEALGNSAG